MFFNSFAFIIFLPLVILLYFFSPYRFRWIVLLIGSYFFYMYRRSEYALLLLAITGAAYLFSIQISKIKIRRKRKGFLTAAVFVVLFPLLIWKYGKFLGENVGHFLKLFNWDISISYLDFLLPLGISFYTFRVLSYVIDVYRGAIEPAKSFGLFALYVSFFPQLLSGPIERANRLLPQLQNQLDFDYERIVDGCRLMLWGFFQKVVIADRLGVFVDKVYNHPGQFEGISLVVATLFFSFQIFCDFSAYSDIAIGIGRVLGFQLMQNFDKPYHARSLAEFWRRWHISLTTWFRDYLYIPMGGNRVSRWRWHGNLLVVFVVSGLWHGAACTFIIWGIIHWGYMIIENATNPLRQRFFFLLRIADTRVQKVIESAVTFCAVTFAWIFFRAKSLPDAMYVVTHLNDRLWAWFTLFLNSPQDPAPWITPLLMGQGAFDFWLAIGGILLLQAVHLAQYRWSIKGLLQSLPAWVRWALYYFFIMSIILFGNFTQENAFIYFQF
jgi:alginate O-acetyltransferase complex protein AlgI